ncbi:MAG: hypothetical protein K5695_13055 [Oscillospiraceae bacterium]|nr:hypothetical protein [Oscillospiraceae bacterium]
MNKLFKIISPVLIGALLLQTLPFTLAASAKDTTDQLSGQLYLFDEKSGYEVDSASPASNQQSTTRLGSLSISGDMKQLEDKNGFTSYEVQDGTVFSLTYHYDDTLANAAEDTWHLTNDGKKTVNGAALDEKINKGVLILQTSFDGQKWVTSTTATDLSGDFTINQDNGINDIQLANGCYYRVIVAYETRRKVEPTDVKFIVWDFAHIPTYEYQKHAEVYSFYAAYPATEEKAGGEKFYFAAGAKNSRYTHRTAKNNYNGAEPINAKNPHYGWDLGAFCLSGYTDTGDSDDVYLKTVGNRIKLSFALNEDINQLQGNEKWVIAKDKNGSDAAWSIPAHDMGHGELIVRHTDSEGKLTETMRFAKLGFFIIIT